MNCSDSRPESVGKQNNTLSCPALNVAFTGHRADSLPWGFNESSDECLKLKAGLLCAIRCAYTEGKRCFLSGMASGVDIYAAEAVLHNCAKHCPVLHWSAFFPARPEIQGRPQLQPLPIRLSFSVPNTAPAA